MFGFSGLNYQKAIFQCRSFPQTFVKNAVDGTEKTSYYDDIKIKNCLAMRSWE